MLRGVLLATASALLLSAAPARADVNYTVTGTADGAGSCTGSSCTTLRAAVAAAVNGDTITLPAGDYSLTTTLTLSHGVIITGPDTAQPTATIKPGPGDGDRVFEASIGGNDNLTIEHVRITGASSDGGGGAALRTNSGTVTLYRDVIDGNGISVQGGALRLDGGVLDITDSTLRGNHAYQGGALFISSGTAVIHSSLFVANNGSTGGGGAIYNQDGFLEAYDSTFVTNTVNSGVGGAIYTSSTTTLRGDTFEENIASGRVSGDPTFGGSALYASTPGVQIANVLFGDSGYGDSCEGNKPTDLGGSVDTGDSCGLAAGERTILLGPLADNGGPTQTLLPWANSQNLNTGANVYCSATDARGVTRANPCDAGAVENSAATNAPAPVIDGVEVASTGNGSAAIDATIDRGGLITSYRVEYGTAAGAYTGDTGNQAVSYDPVGGAQAVEATLSGLTPATTYHYRVVATSPGGTTTGSDQTLTTAPAPTVTTGDATDLTDSTATLLGSINDHGTETGYYFQFGTTTAYGSTTSYGDLGAGDTDQLAHVGIDNLEPGTTYHVRLVASDPTTGSPVVYGQDRTFTTTGSNTSEYTVTDTGDPDNATCHPVTGGNLCTSLRAALAAVSGVATITLQDPGTYTLTHGQMYVNGDVTIVGHSARDTTIDAGGQSRVFNVPNSDQLQLTALTVTGGDALDEPGGDILNAGDLSMIHTRVTGGHAAVGGGVATEGAGATTSITSSLIDGNTAGYGAGVSARSNGDGAALSLSDVTVTGNHGAGVLSDSSENSLQLVSATVARNDGAGVILEQNQRNSQIVDSIVSDNGAANCAGKAQNIAFDVEDAASCGFTTTGSVQNADPQLSAALVNAGGETDVLTIPGTSPANGLIAQCVMGADQRDVDRLSPCDAGAFEYTGTVVTGGPAGTTDDAAPAFTFDAPGGQTYECSLTGPGQDGAFGACTSPRSYADLAPGDYVFSVRPVGGETATRAFTVASTQAAPTPTPTPGSSPTPTATPTPTPPPTPTPVPGKTVIAAPVSGTVLVQLPGTHVFVRVSAAEGIPLGSTVDTRHGVVLITAAGGGVAKFYDGLFKVTQSGGVTILTLTEQLAPCGKGAKIAAKKPKSRKLWGDGHGAFSTRGQYSAATVRGTVWLVQDSCSGTLTRVKTGVVAVRDTIKKKTVLLKAGKSYTAKPKKKH